MKKVRAMVHPEALVALRRMKADQASGHDAEDYWRGAAAAYFTANPRVRYLIVPPTGNPIPAAAVTFLPGGTKYMAARMHLTENPRAPRRRFQVRPWGNQWAVFDNQKLYWLTFHVPGQLKEQVLTYWTRDDAQQIADWNEKQKNPFLVDLGVALTSGIGLGAGWTAAQHYTNKFLKKQDKKRKGKKNPQAGLATNAVPAESGLPGVVALNPTLPDPAASIGPAALNPKKGQMSRWYVLFPGDPYALGPSTQRFSTEAEARRDWEGWYGKKLPRGTQVWRATYPPVGNPAVGRSGPLIIPNPNAGGFPHQLGPEALNPSPYRCKQCGGEIGVGRVLKYVGRGKTRKGPYHEWCAALVRGKGKVQKWEDPFSHEGPFFTPNPPPAPFRAQSGLPGARALNPGDWPYPRSFMPATQMNVRRNPFWGDLITGLALGGGWTAASLGVRKAYQKITRSRRKKK